MSKGPLLTVWEVNRARYLRSKKLTWAVITERLGRDRGGLRRAIKRAKNDSRRIDELGHPGA
jgi:IS30 family transposase